MNFTFDVMIKKSEGSWKEKSPRPEKEEKSRTKSGKQNRRICRTPREICPILCLDRVRPFWRLPPEVASTSEQKSQILGQSSVCPSFERTFLGIRKCQILGQSYEISPVPTGTLFLTPRLSVGEAEV